MNWFENMSRLIDWIYAADYTREIMKEEDDLGDV